MENKFHSYEIVPKFNTFGENTDWMKKNHHFSIRLRVSSRTTGKQKCGVAFLQYVHGYSRRRFWHSPSAMMGPLAQNVRLKLSFRLRVNVPQQIANCGKKLMAQIKQKNKVWSAQRSVQRNAVICNLWFLIYERSVNAGWLWHSCNHTLWNIKCMGKSRLMGVRCGVQRSVWHSTVTKTQHIARWHA